jgi:predicted glutamine amidotransferase
MCLRLRCMFFSLPVQLFSSCTCLNSSAMLSRTSAMAARSSLSNSVRQTLTATSRRAWSTVVPLAAMRALPSRLPMAARPLSTQAAIVSPVASASTSTPAPAVNALPPWLYRLLVSGGLLTFVLVFSDDESPLGRFIGWKRLMHACGIVAFVGDEPATPYLLEGLNILQNRGYDSAGIATFNATTGQIVTTKFASASSTSDCIDLLAQHAPDRHMKDSLGIAHTRWATHGGKTDANAHPHSDYKERVALVHNGTIENSGEIKAELESKGFTFKSQTDTEVIAQLIGYYLDKNLNIMDAVQKSVDIQTEQDALDAVRPVLTVCFALLLVSQRTLARLEGTWGLAIIHKDSPNQVIAARNGSPLVLGIGKNRMFVASELSAFSRHTNQYISLNDGEVAVISAAGVELDMTRQQTAPTEEILRSPAPYPHWTIKEIMEQPEAISRTLGYGGRFSADGMVKLGGLEDNKEFLLRARHLMLAACGTSLFASQYGAHLLKSLKCFDTVEVIDAAEVTSESFPAHDGGLCVVSQSGETKDTHRALVHAQDQLLPCFSIVNQVSSNARVYVGRANNLVLMISFCLCVLSPCAGRLPDCPEHQLRCVPQRWSRAGCGIHQGVHHTGDCICAGQRMVFAEPQPWMGDWRDS